MNEKSSLQKLDELAKRYGMPKPHGLGGELNINNIENVTVVRPGRTIYDHRHPEGYYRPAEVLEPKMPRHVKVTNWLKTLI